MNLYLNRNILTPLAVLALCGCSQAPDAEAEATQNAAAQTPDRSASTPISPTEPIKAGTAAKMFTTQGALAGEPFTLDLAAELKNGPVVLYFFPAAFTSGCTLESKEFADRNAEFEAMGAKVFGLSGDDIDTLARFSREACRDEFAVAQADADIIKDYGVSLGDDSPLTSRTSFVIAQDGTVAMMHDDGDYRDHVRLTFEAVEKLKANLS
ncbi:peroxiredoxin [Parasphingorhabdus sp. DH2-15]|uniref:peroxiredoxin n=1 Tax=Parasphingorhabdus sp. DH2-15 TaxID=3444112 RepID=UPI003F684E30